MSEQPIFLLSPATLNGRRGKLLLEAESRFQLARSLHSPEGAALGDVYTFVSGLYFRGKAAYAARFGSAANGFWIMTPGGGLCRFGERVTAARLAGWQRVQVDEHNPHFTAPLARHAGELSDSVPAETRFVLLGSVASKKYVAPLLEVLGPRLFYPERFAGLGDMARGALLLRCVREDRELVYTAAASSPFSRSP